jgi:hypothetical protein
MRKASDGGCLPETWMAVHRSDHLIDVAYVNCAIIIFMAIFAAIAIDC